MFPFIIPNYQEGFCEITRHAQTRVHINISLEFTIFNNNSFMDHYSPVKPCFSIYRSITVFILYFSSA